MNQSQTNNSSNNTVGVYGAKIVPGLDEIKDSNMKRNMIAVMHLCMDLMKNSKGSAVMFSADYDVEILEESEIKCGYLSVVGFNQHLLTSTLRDIAQNVAKCNELLYCEKTGALIFKYVERTIMKPMQNLFQGTGKTTTNDIKRASIREISKRVESIPIAVATTLPQDCVNGRCRIEIQKILSTLMRRFNCNSSLKPSVVSFGFDHSVQQINEISVLVQNLSKPIDIIALSQIYFAIDSSVQPFDKGITFKIKVEVNSKRRRGIIVHLDEDFDDEDTNETKRNHKEEYIDSLDASRKKIQKIEQDQK